MVALNLYDTYLYSCSQAIDLNTDRCSHLFHPHRSHHSHKVMWYIDWHLGRKRRYYHYYFLLLLNTLLEKITIVESNRRGLTCNICHENASTGYRFVRSKSKSGRTRFRYECWNSHVGVSITVCWNICHSGRPFRTRHGRVFGPVDRAPGSSAWLSSPGSLAKPPELDRVSKSPTHAGGYDFVYSRMRGRAHQNV